MYVVLVTQGDSKATGDVNCLTLSSNRFSIDLLADPFCQVAKSLLVYIAEAKDRELLSAQASGDVLAATSLCSLKTRRFTNLVSESVLFS